MRNAHADTYSNSYCCCYGHAYFNANSDAHRDTDCNSHGDSNTDADSNSNSHGDGHANYDCNTYRHGNAKGNTNSETQSNAEVSSHPTTAPIGMMSNDRRLWCCELAARSASSTFCLAPKVQPQYQPGATPQG
jgi:hypothetical protein